MKVTKVGDSRGFWLRENQRDKDQLDICTIFNGKTTVWGSIFCDFLTEAGTEKVDVVTWEGLPENTRGLKFKLILDDYEG